MESQLRWGCDYLLKTFDTSNSSISDSIIYQARPCTFT